MVESGTTVLTQAWVEVTGAEPPRNLLSAYFPRIDETELAVHGAIGLAAQTARHLDLAAGYDGGDALIDIRNPGPEEPDHAGNRTVIDLVVTDKRYTLSSVVNQLTRTGRNIRSVRHPVVAVDRGHDDMRILATEDVTSESTNTVALPVLSPEGYAAADDAATVSIESWIHLEIDRIPSAEFAEVEAGLRTVLEFVAAADADHDAMVDRSREIAAELRAHAPRTELTEEAAEAARLLDWLDGRFAFLGYREYLLGTKNGETTLVPVEDTAMGISALRETTVTPLSKAVAAKTLEPHVLVLTKANSRSTLIRNGYMDYVGVKTFDADGTIIGEKRFVGLYTSRMYTASVLDIPVVSRKVKDILRASGLPQNSHSGNELLTILETYPRDDLFHADTAEIDQVATEVLDLQEKREARVFIRRDPYERYVSVQVYVPRDLYDTESRVRVQNVLRDYYSAESVDFDVLLSDSATARLHFVARVPRDELLPDPDHDAVTARITAALRSWEEDVAELLAPASEPASAEALALVQKYAHAFPPGYIHRHSASEAVEDISRFEALPADGTPTVRMYRPRGFSEEYARLVVYRRTPALLSDIVPFLSHLGAKIHDERPHDIQLADGSHAYVYDFGLEFDRPVGPADHTRIARTFVAGWTGVREAGGLDRLVVRGLEWSQVAVIRSFLHYLSQANFSLSNQYMGQVFTQHPDISADLVEMFRTKFDPDLPAGVDRETRVAEVRANVLDALHAVSSLDADRVLRSVLDLIDAIVRTNVYRPADGKLPEAMVFKILPRQLDFLPKPRPAYEMWVYSPRVEGVHLRFGKVARGGLRWSDRREDFRTEVLGLVKAQMVKNSLIVPTGAKGGFYPKQLPDPALDREAWAAEGQAAYEVFINALLDVTDDLADDDTVVHPSRTVVHDGDDSYLVVAADKGTARFSDVANGIAIRRGFWLEDAFASGGSVGYDHKAMGITSRGAWKSVERHFRELGVDTARDDFTVVAIGDMSGDVFGNGMLRSEHIRLVAAFDHRDVFLDPDPDPAASYAERQRLFDLPRSSWKDYDTALISAGGGVFPRTAKSIPVSPEAAAVLGVPAGERTPDEVITAILKAPVDLLFNGGIGTYVKASSESDAQVGDKANDAIRIDGNEIRARVVGEGGNLGATQLGRVEAALAGVKINTDAVDNSAGVDCSDHEVNIKLLLRTLIRAGEFAPQDRESVLKSMTEEVAADVLRNNYEQNIALGEARDRARAMTNTHRRLLKYLEREADLDRVVEFLPSDKVLDQRAEVGQGFTSPELAVLLAYTKMDAADKILASDLPDEEWMQDLLVDYFPDSLAKYRAHMDRHPLRREIATAVLVNLVVDRGGLTYLFRMAEETGVSIPQVARTYVAVTRIFDLPDHFRDICALDNVVPTDLQVVLGHGWVRLLDRSSRWLVGQTAGLVDVPTVVDRYGSTVRALRPEVPNLTRGADRSAIEDQAYAWVTAGVPESLAFRSAALLDEFALLDVTQASLVTDEDPEEVAEVYYGVTDVFHGHELLGLVGALDRSTRWTALARGALRDDFYQAVHSIVLAVLGTTSSERGTPQVRADERVAQWRAANDTSVRGVLRTIDEVTSLDAVDQAPLSVLLRLMRGIVRQTAGALL
ncbi:NAD-glutamate dehydrogenase [Brevibacterium litoralis]|uniref:NAD-glutamate dehydrogenase n=1 Tax=Brevibacterium litoralis TaxID=3138935 RepID=UPI0032ECD5CC